MIPLRYILASLWHHRRTHGGVVLGAMVGAAVLIGALWVGDAVRAGLTQLRQARLGQTQSVLVTGERFFKADLPERLTELQTHRQAAILLLPGTVHQQPSGLRARDVQVVGVEADFWELGPQASTTSEITGAIPAGQAILNQALAQQLRVKVGDRLLIRVDDPGPMAREAPLATPGESGRALPVVLRAVVDQDQFGRFGLAADQLSPLSVFVNREWLAEQLNQPGCANVLLSTASCSALRPLLQRHWRLEDLALTLQALPPQGVLELRSDRVFLEEAIAAVAAEIGTSPTGILTYFVNELRHRERATPYSMVAAVGPLSGSAAAVPAQAPAAQDETVTDLRISQWLADDLRAGVGDDLTLSFYVVGEGRTLRQAQVTTRVQQILPMTDALADPTLMPAFPGLATQENCRDWDPGFALDLSRIRPVDEVYWETYRGTPKAWVSLPAGQSWWGNRFGNLTAIRWEMARHAQAELEQQLRDHLDPMKLGWVVTDVGELAVAATDQAMDFGGLFLGCSMFLVLAAGILTALLFALGMQTRQAEVGILLALGLEPKRVRRWLLIEGGLLALIGTTLGVGLALAYTQAVLWGLTGRWQGAMGGGEGLTASQPSWSLSPSTRSLGLGIAINVLMALLAMGWVLWRQRQAQVHTLLSGQPVETVPARPLLHHPWKVALVPGLVFLCLALLAVWRGLDLSTGAQIHTFFLAGALSLAGLLLLVRAGLWWLAGWTGAASASLMLTGLRALSRNRGRNLAASAMLACGLFLVMAVQAQRPLPLADPQDPRSGAGGFSLWAQTSLPLAQHPDDPPTRQILGLDIPDMQGVTLLPWRMRAGDETSCLNLHRPQNPRIFGFSATALAQRQAFTFTSYWRPALEKDWQNPRRDQRTNPDSPWWLLAPSPTDRSDPENPTLENLPATIPGMSPGEIPGEIPGVVDAGTLQWALGRRVGDLVQVIDGRGQLLSIRLVAAVQRSILQGGIVIDEQAFVRHFPLDTGYRGMLVALPRPASQAQVLAVQSALSRAYEDAGLEVVTTTDRLARFNAVEQTYLAIFQMLGGLGLMLGTAGLGVVVLRHISERRGELATLRALGFTRTQLWAMMVAEHAAVVVLGLGCGGIAALLALWPMGSISPATLGGGLGILAGVGLSALAWIVPVGWWALRGPMLRSMIRESAAL